MDIFFFPPKMSDITCIDYLMQLVSNVFKTFWRLFRSLVYSQDVQCNMLSVPVL